MEVRAGFDDMDQRVRIPGLMENLNTRRSMRTPTLWIAALGACVLLVALTRVRTPLVGENPDIIRLERQALDRWGTGDPEGFLDTYAPEITYFDAGVEQRIDGHGAMTEYYRPFTGTIKIVRYEMIAPRVQWHGNVAVLTYNLRSDAVQPDGKEVTVRWNSTSVYALIGKEWKAIHSHWSLTALPCAKGIV